MFAGMIAVYMVMGAFINQLLALFPYYEHLTSDIHFSGTEFGLTYTILVGVKSLMILTVFSLSPKSDKTKDTYMLTILTIVSVGVNIWTTKMHLLFRFGYFYDIYYILFVPNFIRRFRDQPTRIILSIIFMVLGFGYFTFLLIANEAKCVPYQFFWQS